MIKVYSGQELIELGFVCVNSVINAFFQVCGTDGYIMRTVIASVFLILFSGCVSFSDPVPENYEGPVATIADTYTNKKTSSAHFFVLNKINGLSIEDSGYKTRVENSGNGFSMRPIMLKRTIKSEEQTFTISGFVQFATPAQEMFGNDMDVSGDVKFKPSERGRYRVAGVLSDSGSSVWIEDYLGNRVSDIVYEN